MNDIQDNQTASSSLRAWLTPFGLAVGFMLWGLFIYFAVGVKWPPTWDFGVIPDVPGSSLYSTHPPEPGKYGSSSSLHEGERLVPQHVNER